MRLTMKGNSSQVARRAVSRAQSRAMEVKFIYLS